MQSQILVVSDPPHGSVNDDAVAEILGLTLDDTKLKLDFPAPEVLFASDPQPAAEAASLLRGAGLTVAVIDGHDLARIPWPSPVSSFEFSGVGLIARFAHGMIEIPYDVPICGVYCKPPSDPAEAHGEHSGESETSAIGLGTGEDGFAIAEALEWRTNLDLYFTRDGEVRRISIVQDVADFSCLGTMLRGTRAKNMAATIAELERRFTHIELDARLENIRPRSRFMGGEVGFDLDLRKLFSFGTLLLRQVLDSISPDLRDIPQYELGSRLAYLVNQQRSGTSV